MARITSKLDLEHPENAIQVNKYLKKISQVYSLE
jgi:hypothetical protein